MAVRSPCSLRYRSPPRRAAATRRDGALRSQDPPARFPHPGPESCPCRVCSSTPRPSPPSCAASGDTWTTCCPPWWRPASRSRSLPSPATGTTSSSWASSACRACRCRPAGSAGWPGSSTGCPALAARSARTLLHSPHYTHPLRWRGPAGGHRARRHLLLQPRVAHPVQGAVLPNRDPAGGPPGDVCIVRAQATADELDRRLDAAARSAAGGASGRRHRAVPAARRRLPGPRPGPRPGSVRARSSSRFWAPWSHARMSPA